MTHWVIKTFRTQTDFNKYFLTRILFDAEVNDNLMDYEYCVDVKLNSEGKGLRHDSTGL